MPPDDGTDSKNKKTPGQATDKAKAALTQAGTQAGDGLQASPMGQFFNGRGLFYVLRLGLIGGAVTGGLSMAFGATSRAPHGGIFVLFAIENKIGFVIAILAGMAAAAASVIVAKQFIKPADKSEPELVNA